MRTLTQVFDDEHGARAGFVALMCGALVEDGFDPRTFAEPLMARVAVLLPLAAALADACRAQLPEEDEGVDPETDEDDEDEPDDSFEQAREQLAAAMPREQAAWDALRTFWRPAVVVLSLDPQLRAAHRALREPAARIAEYHEAGHWLQQLLSVLNDEPLLVIEPARRLGILGRMSGLVDNFQLNTLLMDVFPSTSRLVLRRRVSQRAAKIARGIGPQSTNDTITGAWNLYTWQAILPGLVLPEPAAPDVDHLIWNEGTPEDIPLFEGRRVVLLGPASYERFWTSQRTFDKLRAGVELERQLTPEEIAAWLQRMLDAKQAT